MAGHHVDLPEQVVANGIGTERVPERRSERKVVGDSGAAVMPEQVAAQRRHDEQHEDAEADDGQAVLQETSEHEPGL